jgi:hypothetical protein
VDLEQARGLIMTPTSVMEICAMQWNSMSIVDLPPDGDLQFWLIVECEIAPTLICLWTSTMFPLR